MSNKCPNCGMSEDKQRSKRINRIAYYCGTDEAGRISVACAEIRRLNDMLGRPQYVESYPDDEGL